MTDFSLTNGVFISVSTGGKMVRQVTVSTGDPARDVMLVVSSNVKVKRDGKRATLDDLREGDVVSCTGNPVWDISANAPSMEGEP